MTTPADLLKTGATWLAARLKQHAARSVTYRRGTATVPLTVTVGSSVLKVSGGRYGEMQVMRTDRDYLFPAADLILSGQLVEPAEGDRVEDATDGRVYECMPPAPGEPPWRYSDNRRTIIRVHVKDVGAL